MGLCEKQKEVVFLLIPITLGLIALCFGLLEPYLALILPTVVDICMATYFYLRGERIKKEKRRFKDLNDNVFKPWMDVPWIKISESPTPFHTRRSIDGNIDPILIEDAIKFLETKKKQYGTIIELRNRIKCSTIKYNKIGDNIEKNIGEYLHNCYPSLEILESRMVSNQNCIIINNISRLIEVKLKDRFLNEKDMWENIALEETTKDNLWRLVEPNSDWGVFIQSKDQKDVSKEPFKRAMKDLILKTLSDDLKQQNKLYREIEGNYKEFKDKVKRLESWAKDMGWEP